MNQESDKHLQGIDHGSLTPLVRERLQSDRAEIIAWNHEVLHGGVGDLGAGLVGVYHFYGQARDGDNVVPWSLVLKSIQATEGVENAAYLMREWFAYDANFLDGLAGKIVAPTCIATSRQPGNLLWIWMEHLVDRHTQPWPLAHYATVAHHFGEWNGSYLTGEPLPDYPWFCHSTAREWAAQAAPEIEFLRTALDDPLIQRIYPDGQALAILQLWDERERFFQTLEGLPQTICHNDAFRRNLFSRHSNDGREQTVAIDWANLGWGAVGEEIAAIVAGNLSFGEVDWSLATAFDTLIFEHYLNGLRAAGWAGDAKEVRLGFTAAAAMKYCFPYVLRRLFSDEGQAWLAQVQKTTDGDPFADANGKGAYIMALAEEARQLMDK